MATVVIVDDDPTWPDQFQQLAAGLRRHLGDDIVGIDHIGSTSVPGLAAKDIIDLQVTVASLTGADRLAPGFQQAGYVLTPYQLDHRPARDPSDPGAAAAYARLKRGLAERLGDNLRASTELKDHACDLIVAAAQDWASTGRQHHHDD
jgi:GrpB-like predicted nucleotidyltransferase (UPF0157 family)